MITKAYTILLLIGGLVLAEILAYYLNVRLDHKAVIAFIRFKLGSSSFEAENSISQSGLNANHAELPAR